MWQRADRHTPNFTQYARWTGVGAQQLLLRDPPAVKLHRQPDVMSLVVSQILVQRLWERELEETNRRLGGQTWVGGGRGGQRDSCLT